MGLKIGQATDLTAMEAESQGTKQPTWAMSTLTPTCSTRPHQPLFLLDPLYPWLLVAVVCSFTIYCKALNMLQPRCPVETLNMATAIVHCRLTYHSL